MLEVNATRLKKLRELQPELVRSKNKISGCFYLSATYGFGSEDEVRTFPYNCTSCKEDPNFIYECFYISAKLSFEGKYLDLKVQETDGKLNSWKKDIPSKYWHVYEDNSLCLGKREPLENAQRRFGKKFEKYFVHIISQYLYHMTYIKRRGIEPWKGDRHGLFEFLENVSKPSSLTFEGWRRLVVIHHPAYKEEWEQLASKIPSCSGNKLEIKDSYLCPFCLLDEKERYAGECVVHEEDIESFNLVSPVICQSRLHQMIRCMKQKLPDWVRKFLDEYR